MLLNNFVYVTHERIIATQNSAWKNGQILINSQNNFMILNGKPYFLEWSIENKTINYSKLSDTDIIPFSSGNNQSLYAVFSKDDKFVYAVSEWGTSMEGDGCKMACYKVDLSKLNEAWLKVSNDLLVSINANGVVVPTIDIVNSKILSFICPEKSVGIYRYYSDPNVKEVIGLSWNGNTYTRK